MDALQADLNTHVAHLIIVEGYKAFWNKPLVDKLDALLWIDIQEDPCKTRRMKKKK